MKLSKYCERDIRWHLKNNSGYYFTFLIAIIIGVILAIIILISNDAYLGLVMSKNKLIYSYINGSASKGSIFFDNIFRFAFPLIIVFLLGFNYYFALFSFVIVSYQFSILVLTIAAIINMYYISGVLVSIILIVPINLVFFSSLIYFSVINIQRSKLALKQKYFFYGYNKEFFLKFVICFIVIFSLAFFVAFLLPMLLKSAIYSIY